MACRTPGGRSGWDSAGLGLQSGCSILAQYGAYSRRNGLLGLMEARVIECRHIEHVQLLQLGKVILLLVEREELLLNLPAITNLTKEIVPLEELSRAS